MELNIWYDGTSNRATQGLGQDYRGRQGFKKLCIDRVWMGANKQAYGVTPGMKIVYDAFKV